MAERCTKLICRVAKYCNYWDVLCIKGPRVLVGYFDLVSVLAVFLVTWLQGIFTSKRYRNDTLIDMFTFYICVLLVPLHTFGRF